MKTVKLMKYLQMGLAAFLLSLGMSAMATSESGSSGPSEPSICVSEPSELLFELCRKYCERLDCDDSDPDRSDSSADSGSSDSGSGDGHRRACDRVKATYEDNGGTVFPCEVPPPTSLCPAECMINDADVTAHFGGSLDGVCYSGNADGENLELHELRSSDQLSFIEFRYTHNFHGCFPDGVNRIPLATEEIFDACLVDFLAIKNGNGIPNCP